MKIIFKLPKLLRLSYSLLIKSKFLLLAMRKHSCSKETYLIRQLSATSYLTVLSLSEQALAELELLLLIQRSIACEV